MGKGVPNSDLEDVELINWEILIQQRHLISAKSEMLIAQLCVTLCNPMDCNPPGSSAHGILQARIQEWAAIPFARKSSRPRD